MYRAAFNTLKDTGVRCSELLGMKIEDIDWETGFVIVRTKKVGNTQQ